MTYPMLLIIAPIHYKYIGQSKYTTKIIASTPVGKTSINSKQLGELKDYIKDNSDLEVKLNGDESAYKTANDTIFADKLSKLQSNKKVNFDFIGIKKGGYGGILKFFSMLLPDDPIEYNDWA